MFGRKAARIESLKETVKHLERRLDHERDGRYDLDRRFNRLLRHLKLREVNVVDNVVIQKVK